MINCNLKNLLESKKRTSEDLNEDTHITKATIRRLLDGSAHAIDFGVLEAICDYLDCTVGDLLEHSKP
ncbi:MAG: putative transcriptional regulator [Arenicella sp.]|jgi:putative transcriptional regulator